MGSERSKKISTTDRYKKDNNITPVLSSLDRAGVLHYSSLLMESIAPFSMRLTCA